MDKPTFTFSEPGKYAFSGAASTIASTQSYPNKLAFYSVNNKQVGSLSLSDPMTFDGNADASAEVFLKAVCQKYNDQVKRIAELEAQLDAVVNVAENWNQEYSPLAKIREIVK